MFSLLDRSSRLCDRIDRREMLRLGGAGAFGLSLPSLLAAGEKQRLPIEVVNDPIFGRAKNIIYLWLQGGPPQHETFDPKPDAPLEIRGPLKPIQTNVVGTQFGELLPRTARIADKLAIVRSLSTNNNIHSSSGYHVLTGNKYIGPNARTISPTDWPWFGSIVKMKKPSEKLPPLSTVWIPDVMRLNENVMPAGQTGGMLGSQWDPDRFVGEPWDPDYEVDGLNLGDIAPIRLKRRLSLLSQVDEHFARFERGRALHTYDKFREQAFDLLTSNRVRDAFAIRQEPEQLQDRYGRTRWGYCAMLARRLIEAGVRMVHVNWAREPGDSAVDNPMWDTHAQNADRLEDALCPIFDVGFTALIEDLDQRGLLDETLVVAIAEFGRTPKINAKAGRDHWGAVFSFAMAGAGISSGLVHGASDPIGGQPAKDRVDPHDVTATIFHLMGIDPAGKFKDPQRREHAITAGSPIASIIGVDRPLVETTNPGGDIARVPPYNEDLLLNGAFEQDVPLREVTFGSRPKGWRATPIITAPASDALGIKLVENADLSRSGKRHAAIGFGMAVGKTAISVPQGSRVTCGQEMRNPRAGTFTFRIRATGAGSSADFFEQTFLTNFTCKLVMFQYKTDVKDPRERTEFASLPFVPRFSDKKRPNYQTFEFTKKLDSPKPGSNFAIGKGLGVAIVVEKTTPGELKLPADGKPHMACLRLDDIELDFSARTINEKVKV
jgi:hypothetical protein